jgi:acetyl-CoA acetyltransferase
VTRPIMRLVRRVGVLAVAQSHHARRRDDATAAEMVYPVIKEAVAASGLDRRAIDYTSAGSSDFLEGRPFSFGFALDAAGAIPPIEESHVEGDAAWAAYEAWVRIQAGAADSALVIGWGKSSEGSLTRVLNATLDPFYEAPLGLDAIALAALQAHVWMRGTGTTEDGLAAVVARDRANAARNPFAQVRGPLTDSPSVVGPLRRSFLPPITDGACAIVMAAEDVAMGLGRPVAWIAGAAHASDGGCVGGRDLRLIRSARLAHGHAAEMAAWSEVDVAELAAPFPHQTLMLKEAFALDGATINPSGGPAAANPIMATGLVRLGEAALQVMGTAGERQVPEARRALAHATAGHCLQSNLVWLLERDEA